MGVVSQLEDGPRVLSVYDGFFSGGARALHTAVVRSLDATTAQRHRVLSLTDHVVRESTVQRAEHDAGYRRLRSAQIPVTALRRAGSDRLRSSDLAVVRREIARADLILSLKEQPLSVLARTGTSGRSVITCLHRSDPEHQGRALEDLVELVDRGVVGAAVCCAHSTQAAYHAATGIPLTLLPVIANGVDLHRYRSIPEERAALRRELGVRGDVPVVMLAARFDAMKDVALFVRSVAHFARTRPDAHVVLCGAGMSPSNPALTDLLRRALGRWTQAQTQVHLLGIRHDMARLHNAADIVSLTSAYGEAAPLSLLEAMACGAVPVTTDVGDAALMVADRRLVTTHESGDVAAAWTAAYELRDEHRARIRLRRQSLSDQRCFDDYAALVDEHAHLADLRPAI